MSEIQTGISKARTLIKQNSDLINYNNSLLSIVAQSMESEVAIGKQEIVDALLLLGVECSMSDSLTTLASKVESLELAVGDVTFTDDVPRPLDMSYFAAMGGRDVITIKDDSATKVRSRAFSNNLNLSTFEALKVKKVMAYAFENCASLIECNMPEVTSLPDYAFKNCTNLKIINFPKLYSIGNNCFESCKSLDSINFPDVISIGDAAFYNASSIRNVNLDALENAANNDVFRNCTSLEYIYAPKLTSLHKRFFQNCSNLKIANVYSVKTIGTFGVFEGCYNLVDLIIGSNFSSNINLSSPEYSPTNAMSHTSNSLVDEGEYFASNNEKWNYNLREHFAANLPDRTGMDALTITFGATVLGNMEEATIAAFNNKNWTLA